MHARSPDDVSYYLFPVQVAAKGRLEIVLQHDMRAVVLFAEDPRNLSAVPMSKLGLLLLAAEAVGSGLKHCCEEQVFHLHESARVNEFVNGLRRNQRHPHQLKQPFKFLNAVSLFNLSCVELGGVPRVQGPVSPGPPEQRQINEYLGLAFVQQISLKDHLDNFRV